MPETLWTAEECANYLRVPVKTLYEWRYHGRGPRAARVGRWLRYDPTQVRAWVSEQAA